MVPHPNMLWLVGLGLVPLTALIAWSPAFAQIAGPFALLLIALACLDAVLSRDLASHFTITMPPLTRMTRGQADQIRIKIKSTRGDKRSFRIALEGGSALNSDTPDIRGLTLNEQELVNNWHCTPHARGQFKLPFAHLETPSMFRLWMIRYAHPVNAEVRVFPDLRDQRKKASSLFLRRQQDGIASIRQMGKGREFEMLREYVRGDSYEDIHWRSTAKRRQPITKTYQIERTQEIYVMIDVSRLSGKPMHTPDGEPAEPVLERFIQSAMLLQQAAAQQGDLFGLVVFSNKIDRFVRARGGKTHYTSCAEALYTLQPRKVSPDFESVFAFIRTRLRKRALMIFLTDLEDPVIAETFVKNTEMISHQHLVFANVMTDPEVEPIFGQCEVNSNIDLYARLARHLQWKNTRELGLELSRKGVHFNQMDEVNATTQVISQYMQVKQRQLL